MSNTGELLTLSAERLWSEFSRALAEDSPATFLRTLLDCRALHSLCPEWPAALKNTVLDALENAARDGCSVDIRFAISCSRLAPAHCASLCSTLRASSSAQRLARLYCENLPLPKLPYAEDILGFLEQFDYLRRPELFSDFCAGAGLLQPDTTDALKLLRQAAAAARKVESQALMARGISGKALGEALRAARLASVEAIENLQGK